MKNLKEIRVKKGLRQIDVAEYLNITASNYSKYERGQRKPDPDTLIKLSKYFDIAVDYLLGNIDVPVSPSEYQLSVDYKNMTVDEILDGNEFHNGGKPMTPEEQREFVEMLKTASVDELKKMLKMYRALSEED